MDFKAVVSIRFKPGVLDAEGKTVQKNLVLLGFPISKVTSVKVYELIVEAGSADEAKKIVDDTCQKMLVNPVIQDYKIEVL